MTLVTSFKSLEDLNTYYDNSFNVNCDHVEIDLSKNTFASVDDFFEQYPQISFSQKIYNFISVQITNNTNSTYYYFPFSKSSFRKLIHPDIPESLYKRLYKALTTNLYIIEATAFHVFVEKKPLTEPMFKYITWLDAHDGTHLLENITTIFSSILEDNNYYISKIRDLENLNSKLTGEIQNLHNQIYNNSMTTWH